MWFNRNRRKKSIFVGKNRIKTRPDSLTNQRLPGINDTKIVFFLDTTKYMNKFLEKNSLLSG